MNFIVIKKIFPVIFCLSVSFSHLNAEYFFQQVKKQKVSPDTLQNKTIVQKDSSSRRQQKQFVQIVHSKSLLENSLNDRTLKKKLLESVDYRFTGDFFSQAPLGFSRDLGSIGQPYETLVYGQGFGNLSFLLDGLSVNNRLSNSLDLNLIQSESIDSIEVIPPARGFLYGGFNNPVSVNFISRELNINKSFSRIKFYQAPNNEGMMDVIFSLFPFSKLNTYVEISNNSTDPYYKNTDYSNWSGNVRLRYLLSKNINVVASYRYVKSEVQLNGGVDADSINHTYPPSQFDQILYDNLSAPVRFSDRYQKASSNDFRIKLLANFFENSFTEISFYHQTNLTEFRQNEYGQLKQYDIIVDDNKNTAVGGNFRQDLNFDFARLTSITNFERMTFDSPLLADKVNKTIISTSAIANFNLLNNSLMPSVFGKYLNYSKKSYIGFGADVSLMLSPFTTVYAGYSSFEKPRTIWEERFALSYLNNNPQKFSSFEISAKYENNDLKIRLGLFNQTASNVYIPIITKTTQTIWNAFYEDEKDLALQGINLNLDFKFWKVLLSTNTSLYNTEQNRQDYKLPRFTSSGGIYYVDTLFEKNLKLKTGINYSFIDNNQLVFQDFEKNIVAQLFIDPLLDTPFATPSVSTSAVRFDFFLAGKIQNAATVYFVFENLLNTKYFVVPYYPKQSRGLRFGVTWEFLD